MSRASTIFAVGCLTVVSITAASVGPSDAAPVRPRVPLCLEVPSGTPGDVAVVNITNTGATGPGYGALRASDAAPIPSRAPADQYSSVNFASGETNPNLAFVTIGPGGEICYDSDGGTADVILDLVAAIPSANVDAGDPVRLVDTRDSRPVRARTPLCVDVPSGAPGDAAVINITNTDATGPGYGALRASDAAPIPSRAPADQYSSVNFASGNPDPNLSIVTIGPDRRICYDSDGGTTNVILDFVAAIPGSDIDNGDPRRLRDTRGSGRVAARSPLCLSVDDATPGDVAIINITNTDATGDGYGALRPSEASPIPSRAPEAQYSSVNYARGQTNPNLAFVRVGTNGQICYDSDGGATNVILDLVAVVPGVIIDGRDPQRLVDTREPAPSDPLRPAASSSFAFLFDLDGAPIRWNPCLPITYRTDLRIATPEQVRALDTAIRSAEIATGIDFIDVGSFVGDANNTRQDNTGADAFFAVYPTGSAFLDGAAGRAGVFAGGFAPEITSATAVIASDIRGASALDVWLHEIGHVVGLDHVDDFDQIMAPFNVVNFGSYQLGDLNGLFRLSSVQGCVSPTVRSKPTADNTQYIVID